MNDPIYIYPDKPTILTAKFQDEFGAHVELKYDIAPMFRELNQSFEGLPERPLELIEQEARETGQSEADLQEKWRLHRLAFIEQARKHSMKLFQGITRQAISETMVLVSRAIAAKTIGDLNKGEFAQRPLYKLQEKLVDALESAHQEARRKFNERIGIARGNQSAIEKFWDDMMGGYKKCSSPPVARLEQKELAEALGVTVKTLRERIKRNLSIRL